MAFFLLASSRASAFQFSENDVMGTDAESSRQLLMQRKRPLCLWNNFTSECGADVIGNAPDEGLIQERNYVGMCRGGDTQESCEALGKCLWAGDECTIDLSVLNGDCFDPAWNTVSRSLQCGRFGTEEKCGSLPGCTWSGTVCESDAEAVEKATEENEVVAKDLSSFQQCMATPLPDCNPPCFPSAGACVSLEIFDGSKHILEDATSPYCQFHNAVLSCIKLPPDACAAEADCQQTPVSCNVGDEAMIRITYAEHPKIQKKIKKAAEMCPALTTEEECFNFK